MQRPRPPFVIAANGPRALRLAAARGQGWVTYGKGGDTLEAWWTGVRELGERLDAAEAAAGRAVPLDRYLSLDGSPQFSLESVGVFEDMVGRAAELGFSDVVTHWPRESEPYAGTEEVLFEVGSRLDALRPPAPDRVDTPRGASGGS